MNRIVCIVTLLALNGGLITSAQMEIGGIYPNLAMYNSQGECGTGAVVPWADRLWIITYGPHMPKGSDDKLFEVTPDLKQIARAESLGGTPANRMIHRESNQLIIGPYFIDAVRNVRAIPYTTMPGRHTGNARHLTAPADKVYFATMEEGLYEVDVKSLDVHCLIADGNRGCGVEPGIATKLPGYHGKGLYSGQGRVVYANNGERDPRVRTDPTIPSGGLAQWFGRGDYELVRRNQFTEVTGPGGLYGNAGGDPIWSMGWDHRSLILMLLDDKTWHAYRLPKSSHSYDGSHGWNTEWPRIRDIGEDHLLMTMHGCFWKFPKTFKRANSAGIHPRSNYLKIVGDFCRWQDRIVLGCDDSAKSEFINVRPFKSRHGAPGQSNSNLWFIEPDRLDKLGPVIGRGSVWLRDDVPAHVASDPFLFAGYDHRLVHVTHTGPEAVTVTFEIDRAGNNQWEPLLDLPVAAGGSARHVFAPDQTGVWIRARTDRVARGLTVHFHYRNRDPRRRENSGLFKGLTKAGTPAAKGGLLRALGGNKRTLGMIAFDLKTGAGGSYYELDADLNLTARDGSSDRAFVAQAAPPAGLVYTVDDASVIIVEDGKRYRIPRRDGYDRPAASTNDSAAPENLAQGAAVETGSAHGDYRGALAVDGKATDASRWVSAQKGEKWISFDLGKPETFAGVRVTSGYGRKPETAVKQLTLQKREGDAWLDVPGASITKNGKTIFTLNPDAPVTARHLRLTSTDTDYVRLYEFELFEKPAILKAEGRVGQARVCREVVTERDLFNCHGTFYELPARNAQGFAKIRPISTHGLAIHDYCSYRGLMLMTGLDTSALDGTNERIIVSDDGKAAVWAGVIDELWTLGKPRGEGGPWKNHDVKKGEPSDPYLMTAFDRKFVSLSHNAASNITFRLEVDIDGTGLWTPYETFQVAPGRSHKHHFAKGFSAYWVRAIADQDCQATAWFVYD